VEQGTRAEGHTAATRCRCCVQAAGYRQQETDKREDTEDAEVKGKEEKES
jgi:hypothetical protein